LSEASKNDFNVVKLQVQYQERALFAPLSISLNGGELLVVMGPSGCGKSSLLGAIAGTLAPELTLHGDVLLDGYRVNDVPIEQRSIGLQYQQDLLFPHLSVAGNLLFGLARGDKKARMEKVSHALASADMRGFENRDVATLSGGQRARVSLLRTLLAKPKLLLLDEPFSRLDTDLRQDFRRFVFAQIQQMNVPAVLVTHDQQDCPNDEYYDLSKASMIALNTESKTH
jgi:putative thiamine transport system ATP-binding protein